MFKDGLNYEKQERPVEVLPFPSRKAGRKAQFPVNILIIDDDVDSALLADSIFLHLGCRTTCALNGHEGREKICALKPDIIIFDWVLDQNVDAGQIVKFCSQTFAKFSSEHGMRIQHRPKIVTYSSLKASEIEIFESPYFEYLDHWQKPIRQRELLNRALMLLDTLDR